MKCFVLLSILSTVIFGAVGCNGASEPLKKDEKENFKGSEMPADAREQMNKSIEEWRKNHPSNEGTGTPGGGSIPSKPPGDEAAKTGG